MTKRDYVRFGVDVLISRGFKVYSLELTGLLNPEYLPLDESDYPHRIKITSKDEFYGFFKEHPDCLVIDFIQASPGTLFIYKFFRQQNICYATFCSGGIPLPKKGEDKRAQLVRVIKALSGLGGQSLKDSWGKLCYFMPSWLSQIQHPSFLLSSAYQCRQALPKPTALTQTIWTHTLDYDIYLQQKDQPPLVGKYAVLIDEYLPYHPDFSLKGNLNVHLNPSKYYQGMNVFLNWFEKTYQMPVKIAAHPSSQYDQRPECFPGREISKGKTAELVKGAQCVFTHYSTAINFAVLYRKPIVFLTSDEINESPIKEMIDCFAGAFHQGLLNIDEPESYQVNCQLNVNDQYYQEYKIDYIKTPDSPDKFFWEIVADHFEEAL